MMNPSESARSIRSEQDADALIEKFEHAIRNYRNLPTPANRLRASETRAALRTALLPPSTDAGEDARRDSARLREQWDALVNVVAEARGLVAEYRRKIGADPFAPMGEWDAKVYATRWESSQ